MNDDDIRNDGDIESSTVFLFNNCPCGPKEETRVRSCPIFHNSILLRMLNAGPEVALHDCRYSLLTPNIYSIKIGVTFVGVTTLEVTY